MRTRFTLGLAALLFGLVAGPASAGSLYNLELLAGTSASGPFSSSLQVAAGQTYFYEVGEYFSPIGTTNTTGTGHTITSLGTGSGVNATSFNVTGDGVIGVTFAAPGTLVNGFENSIAASGGTPVSNGLSIVNAGQNAGVFVGTTTSPTNPEIVMTGTFTTAASLADNLTSTLSMSWGGIVDGFRINGGPSSIIHKSTTETGPEPYVGYQSLTLTTPVAVPTVPEPPSVAILGLASVIVTCWMAVRRRLNRKQTV